MTWVELEEAQRGVGGVQWRGGVGEAERKRREVTADKDWLKQVSPYFR